MLNKIKELYYKYYFKKILLKAYNLTWFEYHFFNFMIWTEVKKLHLSCWLWDFRGLKTCKKHGFYYQSWINGKCKKCNKYKK